jgi:DNA polymerase I-like protein with 3'-5' exonuclease and polymerase domains
MDPYNAQSLPGSDRLGVPKGDLATKAKMWLKKHPAVSRYRKATERQVLQYGFNTSAYGRRRYFLEYNVHRKVKQGLDNPMQATAADIMNSTIIKLWDLTKSVGGGLVYPMHDSIKWRLPVQYLNEYLPRIQDIVQQPRELNGVMMDFPADFEVKYGQN